MLLGCASNPPPPTSSAVSPPQEITKLLTTDEQLAELERAVADTASVPRLGKSDVLSIAVYNEPDLSVQGIPVRPDSKISVTIQHIL